MNYRHGFHAGNFADVVKHAILALVIGHLSRKEKPFCVFDSHSGRGLYDLGAEQATRSPEWREGVLRVINALPQAPQAVAEALAPFLAVIAAHNAGDFRAFKHYPGSPLFVLHGLRASDRLIAIERHPEEAAALRRTMAGDSRTSVHEGDGYERLLALLPPKERRGLVLIDPPFEAPDEFERLTDSITRALEKWPTGVFILWRPLKDAVAAGRLYNRLSARLEPEKLLRCDLAIAPQLADGRLTSAGVLVINPPYGLAQSWSVLSPWLHQVLAQPPKLPGERLL